MTTAPHRPRAALLTRKLAEALDASIPELTPRRIHGPIAVPGKATAVIGMRRAGKTTFLHQIRRERVERGIPRERLLHLDLEDEELVGAGADDLRALVEEYYRRFPAVRGVEPVTICLDEIQNIPGWERFVRRVLDREKVEIFMSGSSSALLSREIATAMRGRAWEVLVHPFGFEEFVRHRGVPVPEDPTLLSPRVRSKIESLFTEYLTIGGFPEVQTVDASTRARVLKDYVDVAMLRDVMERHRIGNVTVLRWLVRHLMGNAASTFSVTKFFAALKSQGLRVSKDSVHDLLAHLQDCFLVRVLWMEAGSERQRMVNPRKVYPVDPGLIPVFDRARRENTGHALETAVLVELERRRAAVTYVRTRSGREVDFLAKNPDGSWELIQVCADARDEAVAERELRALDEIASEYPGVPRRLLTLTADSGPREAPPGVVVEPAYVWMLSGRS